MLKLYRAEKWSMRGGRLKVCSLSLRFRHTRSKINDE